MNDAPPDTGPRRFGNVAFRKWYHLVEGKIGQLLGECLGSELKPAFEELEAYLLGSFGSPQRLDYGTGHELSFIAFLGCLWKLNFFTVTEVGVEERSIDLLQMHLPQALSERQIWWERKRKLTCISLLSLSSTM